MKKIFIVAAFLLLLQFDVYAQSDIISNAIFPECANVEKRGQCGNEKVKQEISKLLTENITADLKKTLSTNYFNIYIAFISDIDGNVMPETLKIKCDNKLVHDAVYNYIIHLTPFIPKDKSFTERRSVHLYDYTFIYDHNLNKYTPASKEQLKEENIEQELMPLGVTPACKGCENENREIALKCTSAKIRKIIVSKFRVEKIDDYQGTIQLIATFIIERDGSVKLDEITSVPHNEKAIYELKYILYKLPDFTPGNYMDIPVRTKYALPVTVSL